ncbi:MAG: DNA polymerase ligase N-terminal domain-containing protein [Vicinamibacteria bacterium]
MGVTRKRALRRFVVQRHRARTLHYDFRLEKRGVLKSWAVPKGPPEAPGERRLAIETENHPLEYGEFEGRIPRGEYGAGTVEIWDRGTYETIDWTKDKIAFVLHGRRLKGLYALVRFRRGGEKQWLLLKGGAKRRRASFPGHHSRYARLPTAKRPARRSSRRGGP